MSELIAEEAAGSRLESDISLNGTAMDGQPSLFGYCPHWLVSLDHDDDGNRYIEVASHHVSSQKINCVVPPNLPVLKIHAALSKTQGQDETRVVCLFTVRTQLIFPTHGFYGFRLGESGPCVVKRQAVP